MAVYVRPGAADHPPRDVPLLLHLRRPSLHEGQEALRPEEHHDHLQRLPDPNEHLLGL